MAAPQVRGDQISIEVKLWADLRRFLPKGHDGPLSFTLPPGSTVADVIELIGIPARDEITAGVNGALAQRDTVLQHGDELMLFSPMEGGGR
jgi:sulfur carrier protein ThiS